MELPPAVRQDTASKAPEAVRIGQTIRALISLGGGTITDTARAAGISQPYLQNILSGHRHPSAPVLNRIAAALGVPPLAIVSEKYYAATVDEQAAS